MQAEGKQFHNPSSSWILNHSCLHSKRKLCFLTHGDAIWPCVILWKLFLFFCCLYRTYKGACNSPGITVTSKLQVQKGYLISGQARVSEKPPSCNRPSSPHSHPTERREIEGLFLAPGISRRTWSSGLVCNRIRALLLIPQIYDISTHAQIAMLRNKIKGGGRESSRIRRIWEKKTQQAGHWALLSFVIILLLHEHKV